MTLTRQELFDGIWEKTIMGFAEENSLHYETLQNWLKKAEIPRPSRKENLLIKQGNVGREYLQKPELPGDPNDLVSIPEYRKRTGPKDRPAPVKTHERRRGITPKVREQAQRNVDRFMKDHAAAEDPQEPLLSNFRDNPRWNTLYFLAPAKRQRVIREADHIKVRSDGLYHPLPRRYQQEVMSWVTMRETVVRDDPETQIRQDIPALPKDWDDVSIENYSRIFLILDAVYSSLELLGEEVLPDGAVLVSGRKVTLRFSEGKSKVYKDPTKEEAMQGFGPRPEFRPNGKLTLSIGMLYSVKDNVKERIEARLGDVLELIYTIAFQMSNDLASDRESVRKQNRSYAREYDRTEDLLQMARDYEDAARIRNLVQGVRQRMAQEELPYAEFWGEWAAWASRKAEWLDPITGFPDPILGRRHDPILQPLSIRFLDKNDNSGSEER